MFFGETAINLDAKGRMALPTVMAVHKGKLVDSFQGALADAQLKAWVDKGKPEVYLALVMEVRKRVVKIRWLHELEGEQGSVIEVDHYRAHTLLP